MVTEGGGREDTLCQSAIHDSTIRVRVHTQESTQRSIAKKTPRGTQTDSVYITYRILSIYRLLPSVAT
jgi:hypothetical protein